MVKKCIINCAVTGSIHIPSQTPYLPITPEQITNESLAAHQAGAATVHLHARDPESGKPTMDLDLFRAFCTEIKEKSDVVICITTGGSPAMTIEERMSAVRKLKPELASVNMGSMNFGMFPLLDRVSDFKHDWEKAYLEGSKDLVFKNTFADQEQIFRILDENGTRPELECYDIGHLYNTAYWADKGLLRPPFWIQFILGITGAIQPSVENLVFMKNTADKLFGNDYVWSVLAAGRHEFSLGSVGAIMGGSVRVGLEDNIYLSKGRLASGNGEMVAKMKRILNEFSIESASSDEARVILGLKGNALTEF